jgi:DNA replication protein DnaC
MKVYRDEQVKENARLFRLTTGDRRDFRPLDYLESPNPKNGIPDRAYMTRLLERLDSCGSLPPKNIAFTGESGIGKKYLTALILRRAIESGEFCVCTPAYTLARLFEDERFARSEYAADELDRIRNASLLIIDELGTEQTTAYSVASLLDILDSRFAQGLITVITTGLTENELAARYNPELLLRVREQFITYYIPLTAAEAERNKSFN